MNINDLDKINRLTIDEYQMLMKAATLKSIDQQEKIFTLAWAIRQAKAQKKGKYVYKNFKQFFNRDKIESQVFKSKKNNSLIERIREAYKVVKE